MADAIALCAVVQALGNVASAMYYSHLKRSVHDQAARTDHRQRSTSTKSTMKLGKKKSKKLKGVTDTSKTKHIITCDKESEPQIDEPKTLTKRIVSMITDSSGGHQKNQLLANNAKLENETHILKKQLHAEQQAISIKQLQSEQHVAEINKHEQEKATLRQHVNLEQQNTLASEKRLTDQIVINEGLVEQNEALSKSLDVEIQFTFTNQCSGIEQYAKLEAEKKVLLDALDHAKAISDSNQREFQEMQSACATLRGQVEDAERRAQAAKKIADAQTLKSADLEQSASQAEAQASHSLEKLVAAEQELAQAHKHAAQLKDQVCQDQASINTTEEALKEANAEINRLRGDLEDEEENTRCLQDTNQKLEADLAETKALADHLQKSLNEEKEKGVEGEHQKLTDLNTELQKKAASMKAEIKHLKDSLDISENEALMNLTDLDEARAQNATLVEQLSDANERADKQAITTADLNNLNDDEIREKLAQAIPEIHDTQTALAQANERLSIDNLTQLANTATIAQKDAWIDDLENTLSDREEKLNMLDFKLKRISKLVTKNMADFCEYGVEEEVKLRERCQKKNMQQQIPHCDYLKREVDEMLKFVSESE